ncbi:hypothetical protein ACFVQ9_36020 [Streptomyces goshikiensis]|uniref:hypothetical protein n=1 Tax=Streptomyces goshikiensis TaxID=1942 RepID=UPI003681E965
MGYLRTTSFLIFHDPKAPDKEKTFDAAEIAKIEAEHEAGKQDRIDALITKTLKAPAKNYSLAIEVPAGVPTEDDTPAPATVTREGLREIVQRVQDDSIIDENAFKKYLRETFRAGNEKNLRDFAWEVYGIATSKATLPDTKYRPFRDAHNTVRFKDGARFGVNEAAEPVLWAGDKVGFRTRFSSYDQTATDHAQRQTLWVKVADGGWEEDGNWGGYLQITSGGHLKGLWIDSIEGWVTSQGNKVDGTTFYDMGPYYQIWQGTKENGRPLVVENDRLRFVEGATPGKFQIEDATWR